MSFFTREYKFEQPAVNLSKKGQHQMVVRTLRSLVKPLFRLIRRKQESLTFADMYDQNVYNSSIEDMRTDPVALNAKDDNLANEALEQRIFSEVRQCQQNAAIIVKMGDQQTVLPVHPKQQFIPVHFARTSTGTFFWTSMDTTRQQEVQLRSKLDRWGQA